MMSTMLVELDAIERAAGRIEGRVRGTPLLDNDRLSQELAARVLVKAENLQLTGSFKVRGALNAVLSWRELGRLPAGVAAFSAGNHAAAVAYAASEVGLPAVVCMPPSAVPAKVEAVRRYGGEVIFTKDLVGTCKAVCAERGYELLHPFDDPAIIAGQGTVGLEILASCPDPDLVVVGVGGGGLISGVAAAIKAVSPGTRVVGAEPATANAMSYALRQGRAEPLPSPPVTIADGLSAPFASERTLAHVKEHVDEVVEVTEQDIEAAWRDLIDATKLVVEPAGAVGLAALRAHASLRPAAEGATVVLLLSGGNADLARLAGSTPT
jgi:threo-3-hydroxy-L-aspartate ammonia-lyase